MIREIDEWVLRKQFSHGGRLEERHEGAVNISSKAICHVGIADMVKGILVESRPVASRSN